MSGFRPVEVAQLRDYRDALGRFATGVTLVATNDCGPAIVMTVNSFSSLSLTPPLIGWCVDRASDRFERFHQAETFGVSVLASQSEQLALTVAREADLHALGLSWEQDRSSLVLSDALAGFHCETVQRVDVGDHVLLVGEVFGYRATGTDQAGLVFSRGKFSAV
jgi:3-hydroxy-9,10-secoandrosta-1,3,5(10)-triene-9,17-dione monooxygenase reductase component